MIRLGKLLISVITVALIATLSSCGGPGGSQVADGGIGGTGITMGRVTGFGSIFVNGIEFETSNANFTVNDVDGMQSDIAIGMVVRISGSSDSTTATGSADSVMYDSLIEGIILSNDITLNGTLTVMDQTITIDVDTVYENPLDATLLANLPLNSAIEVSGFTDGNGTILATRIEVKSLAWAGDKLEVSGVVSAISGNQFNIGNLIIDASNALPIPAEGTFVEVQGNSFSGSTFIANSILIEDDANSVVADDGEEVIIEGQITEALDSSDHFALNGHQIDASSTPYSGATSQLTVGRVAKVEGVMNGDTLLAEVIILQTTAASERGEIGSILGIDNVDASAGTITLLGQTIVVNNSTIMDSDRDDESTFTLSQLTSSDYLEANVYQDGNTLIARKLELENPPNSYNAEVSGLPAFVDASTIQIFGVVVDTSGVDNYTFDDRIVLVKGNFSNGVLIADTISYDDHDHDHDDHDSDDHDHD